MQDAMRKSLAQIVHWHSRWRTGLYNLAILGFLFQVYHLREDWRKKEPVRLASYMEDLSNLQRIMGISLSLVMASKLIASVGFFSKLSDSLFGMAVVEMFLFAFLYYSKGKNEHYPLASVYFFSVVAQEMYMDRERENVVAAYRSMTELLAKAEKRKEPADPHKQD